MSTSANELTLSEKLTGKVAIVTGASKGIGAAIAKHLAAAGASVVVNFAASKEGAQRVVAEIEARGGKAIAVQADLAVETDISRLFVATIEAFGRLDILVNNAGVYEFAPLEAITAESFHRMFNLNVLGLLLATKQAATHFGPEGGSVINVGSVAAQGVPGASVYSSTKGAVDTITKSLAGELGPRKIRVNSLNPGAVVTEGVQTLGLVGSDFFNKVEAETPLGRIGEPDDIAKVAVFLASDDSAWITGETVRVAGGNQHG